MLTTLTTKLVADIKKIQEEMQNEQMQNRKVIDAVGNEIEKERRALELAGKLISGRLDVLEKAIGHKSNGEGNSGLAARLDELEHAIGELGESMTDPQAPIGGFRAMLRMACTERPSEIPQPPPRPVTHEIGVDPIPEIAEQGALCAIGSFVLLALMFL